MDLLEQILKQQRSEEEPTHRDYKVGTINEKERTVELVFSSEEPVTRSPWWGEPYIEILDHSPENVNLERLETGAHPLLLGHDREQQIGVVLSAVLDLREKVGRAKVKFGRSALAEDIFRDVKDGIRKLVSVGYAITDLVSEVMGPDGMPIVRFAWMPHEISIVPIPADFKKAGVGRAQENHNPKKDFAEMEKETATLLVDVTKERADAAKSAEQKERTRTAEIIAIGNRFVKDTARAESIISDAIQSGQSVDAFRAQIMDSEWAGNNGRIDTQEDKVDLSEKDKKEYSLFRALDHVISRAEGKPAKRSFEDEVSEEIARKVGADPEGIYVPTDLIAARALVQWARRRAQLRFIQRDLTTAGSVANLIGTDLEAGSFIEVLRNVSILARLGARSIGNLVGNVDIPKQSGSATGAWVAEEAEATLSDPTFTALALTPKTVSARTKITRQVIKQANPDIEALVMEDLAEVVARVIDLGGIAGTGLSNQPTGILNATGVGSVAGASMDWAKVVELETDVAEANADVDTMAYLSGAAVRGLLKTREKTAGSGKFLWESGEVNGYRHAMSNQCPAATMVFGVFSQVIFALWGGLDLKANPFLESGKGNVFVEALQSVDVGIRHAASFSVMSSIS